MAVQIGDKLLIRLNGKKVICKVIEIENSVAVKRYYGTLMTVTIRVLRTNAVYILEGINRNILGGVTKKHLEAIPLDGGAWKMAVDQ